MDSLKLFCRICLEHKAGINWNDTIKDFQGTSYKDCYYKYTQLDKPNLNYYPTNLCDRCANEIRNAHILFQRALDSLNILQNTFKENEHFLLKNCNSSQVTICDTFEKIGFNEEKGYYDIDEVICYSPVSDGDLVPDTKNELHEITYEQNMEPSLKVRLEQQSIDSYYTKVHTSDVDNEENVKKMNPEFFETTLELNLQLEIHGSNVFKQTAKKTATKVTNSLQQTTKKQNKKSLLKKSASRQTFQSYETNEKPQNSNQKLSKLKSPVDIAESLKANSKNNFEEQTSESLDQSLAELKTLENYPNNSVNLNPKRFKIRELNIPSIVKSLGKTKKQSELIEYLLFKQHFMESDKNCYPSLTTKLLKSRELQKLTVSDNSIKQNEKLKQSVISLSEELFGKDADKDVLDGSKPQKPKEIMCQYCSKVFITTYKAIEHEKTHLENRERNETCAKCGLKFYNKNALRSHMYTHKENREKNLKCEFCGKAFYNNNGLSIHRKIHVGPRMPCNICSKEYYRKSDLDKHMVSHSATRVDGDLKYTKKYFVCCEICGNEVRSVYYKSHIAKHNNEPLAKCAICKKEFFSRKSCLTHLKCVHRKGSGERSNFAISYTTKFYSKLFLEQSTGSHFTK